MYKQVMYIYICMYKQVMYIYMCMYKQVMYIYMYVQVMYIHTYNPSAKQPTIMIHSLRNNRTDCLFLVLLRTGIRKTRRDNEVSHVPLFPMFLGRDAALSISKRGSSKAPRRMYVCMYCTCIRTIFPNLRCRMQNYTVVQNLGTDGSSK